MSNWKTLCRIEDIPKLGGRRVTRANGGDIAVFRASDDHVFAVLDSCPHKGGPLSQGIVFGHNVACPLHNWTISLDTGCAAAPDVGCVQRFTVKVDAGVVWLDLDELAKPPLDPGAAAAAAGGNDAAGTDVTPTAPATV
ncbi:nitrite reductase small subunit NirD [soil metagenome]